MNTKLRFAVYTLFNEELGITKKSYGNTTETKMQHAMGMLVPPALVNG